MNVQAAPEQEPLDRGGVAGGQRRERVEQDAPHQHAAASEQIGEVTAQQAEDAAGHRGDVLQRPDPRIDLEAVRRHAEQIGERRPHDERQHQQFVAIEREAERRHAADDPLHRGQSRGDGRCRDACRA